MARDHAEFVRLLRAAIAALANYTTEWAGGQPAPNPRGPAFYRAVAEGMNSVEDRIHAFLHANHCIVALGDLLVNMQPRLIGAQLLGQSGWGWETVSAYYDPVDGVAYVAEFIKQPFQPGALVADADVEAGVREELGHALDHALHWPAHAPAFLATYRAEATRITDPNDWQELCYRLGPSCGGIQVTDEAAASELFAALFAARYGGAPGLPSQTQLLLQYFSQTYQLVLNEIARIP
ncbi:MAG: hypothetical protein HYS12_16315 [Planctomycetes bacterium]|nr:hypothetical protein [Planctomycetota bacterium]